MRQEVRLSQHNQSRSLETAGDDLIKSRSVEVSQHNQSRSLETAPSIAGPIEREAIGIQIKTAFTLGRPDFVTVRGPLPSQLFAGFSIATLSTHLTTRCSRIASGVQANRRMLSCRLL